MDILPIFCDIDDFCLLFEPLWRTRLLTAAPRQRQRAATLCLSEVMTIIVLFHSSGYRNFKTFCTQHVLRHMAGAFPRLVSYHRFVNLIAGLIAYTYREKKPSLNIGVKEQLQLPALVL